MSRKFKKTYTGFSREILKEFMSEKELEEMDRKYNEAKMKRLERKIKKELDR